MSRLTVGFVTEGNSDQAVLEELLLSLLDTYQLSFQSLQPEIGETQGLGERGGGWRGVERWCSSIQEKGGLHSFLSVGIPIDLLLIHIDGDVVRESETPIASDILDPEIISLEIQNWLLKCLREDFLPSKAFFVVTIDEIEAWALAAYCAEYDVDITSLGKAEQIQKPAKLLVKKPYKLLKTKNGEPYKGRKFYKAKVAPLIVKHWEFIKATCIQAAKFEQDLHNWLELRQH